MDGKTSTTCRYRELGQEMSRCGQDSRRPGGYIFLFRDTLEVAQMSRN